MAEVFNFYVQDNRSIIFPKNNLLEPIMQEDKDVATWRFRIPKVLNQIDMSRWSWWFVYVNAKGQEYSKLLTLTDDIDEPASYSTADYNIDYGISKFPGSFSFALEAISTEQGGEISGEWHTKTYKHKVDGTLQGNQAEYAETESDIISALIQQIQQKYNTLVGGATPLPVNLKSQMTDHDKVYLYTGTEPNESTGYWYYYNGTAWTAGGLYGAGVQIDTTLSQSGQAADAEAVGRKFSALSENPFDIVQMNGGFKSATHNGITFTASSDGTALIVNGTATAYAFVNLYYNLTKLPEGIKAGGKVRFYITTTKNTVIRIVYACYNSSGTVIGTSQYLGNKDGEVRTIPDGTVGMYIRVGVNSGTVAQNDSITCAIYPEIYESRAFVEFKNADDAVEGLINTAKNTVHGSEIDLLRLFGNFAKTVHNGVTFTPTESGFSATGTASAQAFTNIYFDKTNLVHGITAGMTLAVKVNTSNANLRFVVGFFDETEAYIQPTRYITSDTTVLVPNNAVGMFFRVDAVSSSTLSGDTIDVNVFAKVPDKYYGLADYVKTSAVSNGISYAWDEDSGRYHISGTATGSAGYYIWNSSNHLPSGMKPGQKIILIYNTASKHIVTRVTFYDVSANILSDKTYLHSGVISVPATAVGLTLQFVVYSPWTVDEYVYPPRIVDYYDRARFMPVPKGRPKYISFIDDDTTSDTYVERYFNACMHNGVKGNFAVCTARYVNGTNDVEKLQDYEAEGFNLCLHCDTQETYLYPTNADYNPILARKNYIRAINGFRTLGLVNTKNAWIIPYGSTNEENMKIAKDLGFDVAFSTSGDTYNTAYDNDVYMLKRTGLSSSGDVSDDTNASELGTIARCKARVDELADDPDGGWLIITTHFNEWDDETWNSNTDANGYQIGYARFNEFVQYALSKGLVPISIGEGVSYIKPILEQNSSCG